MIQQNTVIFPRENYFHDAAALAAEQSLVRYASEAAYEMNFENAEELLNAVKRAMDLCRANGFTECHNFRRIFKSTPAGLVLDWKLSLLAYHMVRLNGDASNPRVAELQVKMLKQLND